MKMFWKERRHRSPKLGRGHSMKCFYVLTQYLHRTAEENMFQKWAARTGLVQGNTELFLTCSCHVNVKKFQTATAVVILCAFPLENPN